MIVERGKLAPTILPLCTTSDSLCAAELQSTLHQSYDPTEKTFPFISPLWPDNAERALAYNHSFMLLSRRTARDCVVVGRYHVSVIFASELAQGPGYRPCMGDPLPCIHGSFYPHLPCISVCMYAVQLIGYSTYCPAYT